MLDKNTDELIYKRQLDAVQRLTSALRAVIDPADTKALALDTVLSLLDAEAGSLLYLDETCSTLVFDVVRGPAAAAIVGTSLPANGSSIVGRVFRTGDSAIVNDAIANAEHDRSIDDTTEFTTRSLLTAPLREQAGLIYGVIQLVNKRSGAFDDSDIAVLALVGDVLSMAVENARLAQEAQLAAVARSLGELSHDIGNMLSGILPYLQTLGPFIEDAKALKPGALEELEEFYAEVLSSATDSVQRVQSLAHDVAAAVKGEVAPMDFMPGSPLAIAQQVTRTLGETARSRGVSLEIIGSELKDVRCDQRRLYNAVYNLVNNALAETSQGDSVTIEIEDVNERQYTVAVRDTGRGMTDEVRRRLFTEAAISTKPGGTGLGTRIVRRIVEKHGGSVRVVSALGEGTTISLLLPKEPTDPPQSS